MKIVNGSEDQGLSSFEGKPGARLEDGAATSVHRC